MEVKSQDKICLCDAGGARNLCLCGGAWLSLPSVVLRRWCGDNLCLSYLTSVYFICVSQCFFGVTLCLLSIVYNWHSLRRRLRG